MLLGSLVFILMAWQETRREQLARRAQGKHSAPSFFADARHSARQKKLDYALAQLDVALDFDPELTEAWLLKGQLQIGQKKFEQARKSLAEYLQRKPDDASAKKLVELCRKSSLDDGAALLDFADTLARQKEFVLAEVMLSDPESLTRLTIEQRPGPAFLVSLDPERSSFFILSQARIERLREGEVIRSRFHRVTVTRRDDRYKVPRVLGVKLEPEPTVARGGRSHFFYFDGAGLKRLSVPASPD